MNIRTAIVDDNSFLINAVKEKLSFFDDIEIRLTATNGKDLIEKLSVNNRLDIILMDIEMPTMDGIEATRQLKQRYPHIKIVMLTVFDNDSNIFNAIRAGADGYLLKDVAPDKLYNGIKETLDGGAAMNPAIALKTLKLLRSPQQLENLKEHQEDFALSDRELQVLEQLASGLSYTVIAENLILSPSTVRKHIENIYKKLQVHSKLEAIEKARRNNLL